MFKCKQAIGVLLLLILYIVIAQACSDHDNDKKIKGETGDLRTLKVVRIDGCQYLTFRTYYNYMGLAHKGDCDNPIHKP